MLPETKALITQLEQDLGLELNVIEDIDAYLEKNYPLSYREVMTPAEEMVGSRHKQTVFTDKEGRLVGLNLFECGLDSQRVACLETLPLEHLRGLNLAKNQLSQFGLSQHLKALQVANLSQNSQLKLLGLHPNCTELARLELFQCQLQGLTFPDTYHKLFYLDLAQNKSLTTCEFEGGLNGLQVLFLRGTGIKSFSLPGSFPELVYLYLNDNKNLRQISFAAPLLKIDTLQLKNSQLGNFSQEFIKLGNEEVTDFNFWTVFQRFFPGLDALYLTGNPIQDSVLATKLQDQKDRDCLPILKAYFKLREKGLERDIECKVLLIGNGKAGKTQILKRLTKKAFDEDWHSTHGINIVRHELQEYDLYLWDFGGQDIYHNTHRLFMQRDAVYLLAWRKETETQEHTMHPVEQPNGSVITRAYKNYHLNYWLSYAKQQGEDSPMIVVQTNIKEDEIDNSREAGIQEKFGPAFSRLLAFSYVESKPELDTYDSYRQLRQQLLQGVKAIKAKQTRMAKPLFELRKYIRSLQAQENSPKTLDLDTYLAKAKELGVDDPMLELETWLFRTGVVYFKRGVFQNQIVLDQAWMIDAIYVLFDRTDERIKEIQAQRGEFTGAKLQELWAGTPYENPDIQKQLVDFMLSSDVCYEVESGKGNRDFAQRRFIAPKLLPDRKPETYSHEFRREMEAEDWQTYHLCYRYGFLHEKVIEALIARTAYLADLPWLLWQHGTRISDEKDKKQVIYVERTGDELQVYATQEARPLQQKLHQLIEEIQDETPEILLEQADGSFAPIAKMEDWGKAWPIVSEEEAQPHTTRGLVPVPENVTHADDLTKAPLEQGKPQPRNFPPPETIEELILADSLQEAIRLLINQVGPEQKITLLQLGRQLSAAEKGFTLGMLTYDQATAERSRVSLGLLQVIGNEAKPQAPKSAKEPPATQAKKVQLLSAAPLDQSRLLLGKEYRELKKKWKQGEQREGLVLLEKEEAVDLETLQIAINRKPTILHFSGHGGDDGIMLMNEHDQAVPFRDDDLDTLFQRLRGITEIVILNACFSTRQARLISYHHIYAIGASKAILDDACITFSQRFYGAISDGQSYQHAFQDARMLVNQRHGSQEGDKYEVWYREEKINW